MFTVSYIGHHSKP